MEGVFRIGWVRAARCPRVFHYGAKPDPRNLAWIDKRLVQLYHTHNFLGPAAERGEVREVRDRHVDCGPDVGYQSGGGGG